MEDGINFLPITNELISFGWNGKATLSVDPIGKGKFMEDNETKLLTNKFINNLFINNDYSDMDYYSKNASSPLIQDSEKTYLNALFSRF